jgi:hypothetical protein
VPATPPAELGSGQVLVLILSIGLLGAGVYIADWQPATAAFGLVTCSYLILLVAVVGRLPAAIQRVSETQLVAVAALVALMFLVMLALRVPSGLPPRRQIYFMTIAAAAIAIVPALFRQLTAARWRAPALIGIYTVVGAWVIFENPTPPIDVWAWHREALTALLSGNNPYAMDMPNIYGNGQYYGPQMLSGDRVLVGFHYPPLSLYLAVLGHLVGDYRYSLLAATAIAGAVMARGANGPLGLSMMSTWVFLPVTFLVTHLGWTDPFVVCFLAMTVAAASRGSRWAFVPLGLLFAVKHYVVLAAPLIWLLPRRGQLSRESHLQIAAKAAAVALAVTLPFILWDARALYDGLLRFQMDQPFRRDSLSLLAWVANRYGVLMPQWIGWAMVVPATVIALRYTPRTAGGFAMATAFVFFTFFAFSKQAFANYYVFVMGAMAVAAAFSRRGAGA